MDTQLPPEPDGLEQVSSFQNAGPDKTEPKRTTDVLLETIEKVEGERVSIGQLIDGLGERAYGILMLLFALPTILPAPPGMSAVTGMPIVVFSIQLLIGHPHPWLPAFLRRRSILRTDLMAVLTKAEPWLRRVERVTRPRLTRLVDGRMERLAGLVVFFLSIVLILPIFMGNMFPSIAIALIALALMERDGIALIAGYVSAVASTIVAFGFIVLTFKIMLYAVHEFLGL
ncbi:exopolysaccharide biosynthesis protein [Niveispirillum cyanobacteriorum]|uniref:ABC transporter permease n=1 Tax=Niveispirillum cyanobacteriorum TaxID=1612173 RepID=A0A2K9N845_9PROT|nr:exopolysaccharide biosynthesis protein [Niveispirillum cyanobacteriorum]AUN29323.1 ABC transporter permease [Niveispirillum cyanobacteriorum]GGE65223.1 ABC transporter permease [Niveispirillum cyanobacteriorum]